MSEPLDYTPTEYFKDSLEKQNSSTQGLVESVRKFSTGATRSPLGDKLCYEGFLDSRVLKRYAQYMHKHRMQSDGNLRAPDNWKRGIDRHSLVDSLNRHLMDILLWHHGYLSEMEEDIETALCATMFNTMALLHNVLKEGDSESQQTQAETPRAY